MRKSPKPLRSFYSVKRDACYESVTSFKYPFTSLSDIVMLRLSPIMIWCIDKLQVLRMYEMAYVAVRTIDDIADEHDSKEGEEHLAGILDFLETERDPVCDNEHLLQHVCDLAHMLGRDVEVVREALVNIFACVAQDAYRRTQALDGEYVLRDWSEIEAYVLQMELNGIFALIFEIFGESRDRLQSVGPLVIAGRLHFYLLRDVVEDVAEGLINIPEKYLGEVHELVETAREYEKHQDVSMNERLMKIRSFVEGDEQLQSWVNEMVFSGEKQIRKYGLVSRRGLKISTKLLLWGSRRRTSSFLKRARKVLVVE